MEDFEDKDTEEEDSVALAQSFLRPAGYTPPSQRTGHEIKKDKLADMFEPPNHDDADMYAEDIVSAPEISPTDDLTTVKKSDVTGYDPDENPDDMRDLFDGPDPDDADMKVDDLLQNPDQEGVDDLVDLSWDDVSGYPEGVAEHGQAAKEEDAGVDSGEDVGTDAMRKSHWSDSDIYARRDVYRSPRRVQQRRVAKRTRPQRTGIQITRIE